MGGIGCDLFMGSRIPEIVFSLNKAILILDQSGLPTLNTQLLHQGAGIKQIIYFSIHADTGSQVIPAAG